MQNNKKNRISFILYSYALPGSLYIPGKNMKIAYNKSMKKKWKENNMKHFIY